MTESGPLSRAWLFGSRCELVSKRSRACRIGARWSLQCVDAWCGEPRVDSSLLRLMQPWCNKIVNLPIGVAYNIQPPVGTATLTIHWCSAIVVAHSLTRAVPSAPSRLSWLGLVCACPLHGIAGPAAPKSCRNPSCNEVARVHRSGLTVEGNNTVFLQRLFLNFDNPRNS